MGERSARSEQGNPLEKLIERLREIHDLGACGELLGWDQQVYMPPKGTDARVRQMSLLSGLAHRKLCSPELGDLIRECSKSPAVSGKPRLKAMVREVERDYQRAVRVPEDLVRALATESGKAHSVWVEARQQADFSKFAPSLGRLVALKRKEAEALAGALDSDSTGGPKSGELYDALLDTYEPRATVAFLDPVISGACSASNRALDAIRGSSRTPPKEILERRYPKEAQQKVCRLLLERIGFDFERGRMDASVHPFTTSFDSSDVRVTTRYHEKWLPAALFGILHEGGHALYEQGLSPSGSSSENRDYVGTPLREALSLSIHESQSRFWENQVGRSRPFWECFFPTLRDCFPQNLSEVTVDDFYFASNMVRPSPIRVEADEVSYNLHIGMRYELEKSLLRDDVSVGELPGAWNELSRKLLGFEPKDDAEGVLQDIHWSMGLFGYFPTYLLGNLYAAQWAAAAKRHLTGWDDLLRGGKLRPILGWLRENVHRHGRRYTAAELVVRATGSELDPAFYDRYLRNRYGELYGVTWSAPTHENENDQGS